jgi:tricarballylate dehydrogenase
MASIPTTCDVLVVGSGNAALTAALSAHQSGAKVLVIEKAPKANRGGNSRFTGGIFRFHHDGMKDIQELVPGISEEEIQRIGITPYTPDAYYSDLMSVTEGLADPELSEILVRESLPTVKWMAQSGLRWDILGSTPYALEQRTTPLTPEERLERMRRAAWLGGGATPISTADGGEGLMAQEFDIVERNGIEILYEVKAQKLIMDAKGRVTGVGARTQEGLVEIHSKAVILACGSFEANPAMRTQYLGPEWNTVLIRGTKYNTGEILREALHVGAKPEGHWAGAHATPQHAGWGGRGEGMRPAYSWNYGITVNTAGKRFIDEGENVLWLMYAKTGRRILAQPGGLAFQIFDAKIDTALFDPRAFGVGVERAVADTLDDLADQLDLDPEVFKREIKQYNDAVRDDVPFQRFALDGKGTRGIDPPKSNWAQRIDTPPFTAFPVVCGMTFCFGGVKTNRFSQVLDTEDNVIPGLYAVGEMQGGVFYYNYPGASGLMKGAVFGKIAGASAAGE